MTRRLTTILLTTFLLCSSISAYAGSYKAGLNVTRIRGLGTTTVWVGFDVQPAETCSSYNEHMNFDGTTDVGKQLLATLLAALTGSKTVDVWYDDSSAPGTDQSTGCTSATSALLTGLRIHT